MLEERARSRTAQSGPPVLGLQGTLKAAPKEDAGGASSVLYSPSQRLGLQGSPLEAAPSTTRLRATACQLGLQGDLEAAPSSLPKGHGIRWDSGVLPGGSSQPACQRALRHAAGTSGSPGGSSQPCNSDSPASAVWDFRALLEGCSHDGTCMPLVTCWDFGVHLKAAPSFQVQGLLSCCWDSRGTPWRQLPAQVLS